MPITPQQKAALEEIIHAILTATPPKRSRQLAEMFLELVDRTDWGHYYEVRSLGYVCWNISDSRVGNPGTAVLKQH